MPSTKKCGLNRRIGVDVTRAAPSTATSAKIRMKASAAR